LEVLSINLKSTVAQTAHNKRYMLSACSALRVPQNTVRAYALCGILLHHILRLLVLLRKPLSATAKRHIPRTLCANFAGFEHKNILYKILHTAF